jgi:hypothetical protein
MIMDTSALLAIARETISKVPFCFAITTAENGEANARVIQVGKLRDDWSVGLWSSGRDVVPEPKGFGAAVLVREGSSWRYSATFTPSAA